MVAVSFAVIFIRLADAPPLITAAYRMSISAAVLIVVAGGYWLMGGKGLVPGISRRDIPLLGFSSTCLALHFWFWILSLEQTSVASSVVLVTTNPFIVAAVSRLLWGEPLHRHTLLGIAIGIAGGTVIAGGDARGEGELWGDMLAFVGAIAIAGYILAGRKLRAHLSVLTYTTVVYSGAALLLVVAAVVLEESFTGYTTGTYTMMVLLALIPQLVGHSLLNWALAHVTATMLAISVMAEPVIATAAAVYVLGESPPLASAAGGVLIIAGIYVAMRPGGTEDGLTKASR